MTPIDPNVKAILARIRPNASPTPPPPKAAPEPPSPRPSYDGAAWVIEFEVSEPDRDALREWFGDHPGSFHSNVEHLTSHDFGATSPNQSGAHPIIARAIRRQERPVRCIAVFDTVSDATMFKLSWPHLEERRI